MEARMDNRWRLIEAYALQTDFEMGGRRSHAVHVHQRRECTSVVKDVYTARYLYLVSALIQSA